ncbi:MAG: hypothetical protein RLZZ399_1518 [Verrucomicrobiota bacterium]|jgi:hypothetical protein
MRPLPLLLAGIVASTTPFHSLHAKKPQPSAADKAKDLAALPSPVLQSWATRQEGLHRDFPQAALGPDGTPWVVYIEHDGNADTLHLTHSTPEGWAAPLLISSLPGVIHQPTLTVTPSGDLWVFWGQLNERADVVSLRARQITDGKPQPEFVLSESTGSETFADAGTDSAGRVWVTWQSMRRGQADVLTRWLDPQKGTWSATFNVSPPEGGNWEPRLAFDSQEGAWIAYDSSKGREFNLRLARVSLDGAVESFPIAESPYYEARARIVATADRKGFWITAERGRQQWGKPQRGHADDDGINSQKQLLFGHFDTHSKSFNEFPLPAAGRFAPRSALSVNLPTVGVDRSGNPWMAWRFYTETHWRIAVSRLDLQTKQWGNPMEVPDSSFGQDRHSTLLASPQGMLLCWASDQRQSKAVQFAGVHLARLSPDFAPYQDGPLKLLPAAEPKPYLHGETPARPRDEHHSWTVGGKTYHLVWGDVHRHTDFSNCRTSFDGCVLEHFRYGYDVAALDFMGTSDHTDIGKRMHPYEWWQTQRLVDVFHSKGKFHSLYAYEREQPFPWGHRNVVFAQRGGPIVYISRLSYGSSRWNALYPVAPGSGPITPQELWEVLLQYGKPAAVISHTGATGMGTDWNLYPKVDNRIENTVEIFQGARVSYEGLGAPQPTGGLRVGEKYTANTGSDAVIPAPPAAIEDFGEKRNNGLFQNALRQGHKLGVFASSDHIAQHTSFGGVYVEEGSREGIIRGLQARNSVGATDKIFVEFSCNDRPMGQILESKQPPQLAFRVFGTAPLKRITLVRNEENYRVFEPGKPEFASALTDTEALPGENRYYLRVEQEDGNMAWSSPVWFTLAK